MPECFVDGQCNDGTACTVDRCTRGRCAFTPLPGVQYVSCRLDELRAVVDRASSNDVTTRVRRKLDKLLRQAASALRKASQAEVTRRLRPERVDLRTTSKTLQRFRRAVDAGGRRGRISQVVAASVQQHLGVAGEALGNLLASITP